MNKLTIIGNLTKDPVLRSTQDGTSVCGFTVAVNRKKTQRNQNPGADYFEISAWREKGENCAKFLKKGSKVCVIGPVQVRPWTSNNGTNGASMEVNAEEVEFLSSKGSGDPAPADQQTGAVDAQTGMEQVDPDGLPF